MCFGTNPLDAMSAWTRIVSTVQPSSSGENSILAFLWHLNPLPSELVATPRLGEDLSSVLGTVGSVGITTPAFGEVYFVFGRWGSLAMLLLGLAYGAFDSRVVKQADLASVCAMMLAMLSFPTGLHQGIRGMTRYLLYAWIVLIVSDHFKKYVRRRASVRQAARNRGRAAGVLGDMGSARTPMSPLRNDC